MDTPFCETQVTPEADHEKKWFEKHGFTADEEGRFNVDGYKGKLPVEQEQLFQNIRDNLSPRPVKELASEPYDPRTFVMCCGGPSIENYLDEIKRKSLDPENYLVVCSNMTAGYLLEHGIVPHVHFIIDPKESKKEDTAPGKTNPAITYWINAACHPSVQASLRAQGIDPHFFLAQCNSEGKDIEAVKESWPAGTKHNMMSIQGGTMAGLRAINLADGMGFRKMEYYGFDASIVVDGKVARPYAYEKKRGEAVIEVECDRCNAKFDSTLVLQKQVNEFIEWRHRMAWIQMEVIGSGLMPHYLSHLQLDEQIRSGTLPTYRFTEDYAALQRKLHDGDKEYGVGVPGLAPTIFSLIAQMTKRHGSISVLDYGSGGGNTERIVREKFWVPDGVVFRNYDPFVPEFAADPEPANVVLCMDMLEHVEPECTEAVLDHIQSLTRNVALFSISMEPSIKKLADGRNAHINLRDPEYWLTQIRKRFIMSEVKVQATLLMVVGQSIESVKRAKAAEKAAA